MEERNMVRKTDAELLAEIRKQQEEDKLKEKANELEETEEEQEQKTQVIEREITLSLLNDKLNYIISNMSK